MCEDGSSGWKIDKSGEMKRENPSARGRLGMREKTEMDDSGQKLRIWGSRGNPNARAR